MDEKMITTMKDDVNSEAALEMIEQFTGLNRMTQECLICMLFDTMVSQHELDVDGTLTEITGAIRDVNDTCGQYMI